MLVRYFKTEINSKPAAVNLSGGILIADFFPGAWPRHELPDSNPDRLKRAWWSSFNEHPLDATFVGPSVKRCQKESQYGVSVVDGTLVTAAGVILTLLLPVSVQVHGNELIPQKRSHLCRMIPL